MFCFSIILAFDSQLCQKLLSMVYDSNERLSQSNIIKLLSFYISFQSLIDGIQWDFFFVQAEVIESRFEFSR